FVREYEGETVLVVANLSRSVQCARLKLERFKAMVPVELFGRARFPEILDASYFLSLGPHDFYWLALEGPQSGEAARAAAERPVLTAKISWTALLEPARRAQLARTLLGYAIQRRWFRGKARTRKQVSISEVLTFDADPRYAIVLLHIEYDHGRPET